MRLVLPAVASLTVLVGCTQDFNKFLSTGGNGTGSTTTTSTSTTTTVSTTSTSMNCPTSCDDNNPCTTDSCDMTSGTCMHVNLPDMSPLTDTMTGDCKKPVCIAGMSTNITDDTDVPPDTDPNDCQSPACMNGTVTMVANNSEMPKDGNDCHTGSCVNGAPVFANKPDGSTCGAGMAFMCLAGHCGCNMPTDCGTNTDCGTWACTNKVCMQNLQPAGNAPAADQVAGNCEVEKCDGTSSVVTEAFDPTDPMGGNSNPCIADTCVNGTPPTTTMMNVTAGMSPTGCSTGNKECDGAGNCCTPTGNVCAGKTCGTAMDSCNAVKTCGTCTVASGLPDCLVNTCVFCTMASECTGSSSGHACITNSKCGCNTSSDCTGIANATQCDTTSKTCVQCTSNATNPAAGCSVAKPACDTTGDTCQTCAPVMAGSSFCTGNAAGTACITGFKCGCTGSGDCGGATPACNTGTGVCNQCFPVMATSPQCTANVNGAACIASGMTDICGCSANTDCAGLSATPVCKTGGPNCVQCNADIDCTTANNPNGNKCNLTPPGANLCGCASSGDCPAGTPTCNTVTGLCHS